MRGIVLYGALLLLLAACGGGDAAEEDVAAEAIEEYLIAATSGQHEKTWDAIHPIEREALDRQHYLDCQVQALLPKVDLRIEDVEDIGLFPLNNGVEVPAFLVTAELEVQGERFVRSVRAVEHEGAYYTTLLADVYEAYVNEECYYAE